MDEKLKKVTGKIGQRLNGKSGENKEVVIGKEVDGKNGQKVSGIHGRMEIGKTEIGSKKVNNKENGNLHIEGTKLKGSTCWKNLKDLTRQQQAVDEMENFGMSLMEEMCNISWMQQKKLKKKKQTMWRTTRTTCTIGILCLAK